MIKNYWKFSVGVVTGVAIITPAMIIISCASPKEDENRDISLANYQGILWQTTAERRADIRNKFANAKSQFDQVIKNQKNQSFLSFDSVKVVSENKVEYTMPQNNKYIPVVMADLDETFLDNTAYHVFLALKRQRFSPQTWHQWVQAKKAPIYDGVLDFVKHVWSHGAMVFFSSNRNQGDKGGNKAGDELVATRLNLIKKGYPKAFLDSHVWWMKGALQVNDKVQNDLTLKKMETKEQRYNYLNDIKTRISNANFKNMGISDLKNLNNVNESVFQNMPVQIIMRIGDDLNDFNDNLTKGQNQAFKHNFLDNKNIQNLIGTVGPRISFKNDQNNITQYYFEKNLEYDANLLDLKLINAIKFEDLNFEPQETYAFIGGNNMYGGWLDQYAQNFNQINESLQKYWQNIEGDKIFN